MTGVYLNVNFSLTSASFPSNRSKSFIARLESFLLTPERLVIIDMYFHTSFKTWGKQQKSVTSKTLENKRVVFVGKISLSNPKEKDNLQCIADTWTQSASIDFRGINVEYIWFERLFLLLFEWFRFKWPFNTGGKQHKQAVGTWSKVKITIRNGKNCGTLAVDRLIQGDRCIHFRLIQVRLNTVSLRGYFFPKRPFIIYRRRGRVGGFWLSHNEIYLISP